MLEVMVQGAQQKSREWQRDQLRRTGFATARPELGHSVVMTLRELGYSPTIAQVGGQLAAVQTEHNFQGNQRIAQVVGRAKRTVQRARARLEADGWIRSELLLTGELIDGMRAPVWHPQVIRDVGKLQRLALAREATRGTSPPRRGRKKRKGPSAAEYSQSPVEHEPMTAAQFAAMGEAHPEFAVHFATLAAAAAKRETAAAAAEAASLLDVASKYTPPKRPPNAPEKIDPAEIDRWEEDTERMERGRAPPERAPPERGPPPPRR